MTYSYLRILLFLVFTLPFTVFAQLADPIVIELAPNGVDLKIYPLKNTTNNYTIYINQYGVPAISVSGENNFRWSEYRDATEGQPETINDLNITYYNDLDHDGFIATFDDIEFEYYDRLPGDPKSCRLQYIDGIEIQYFGEMEGKPKEGKIQQIGDIPLNYYYGFDNEGKLSKAGKIRIYYHQEDNRSGSSGRIDAIEGTDNRIMLIVELPIKKIY